MNSKALRKKFLDFFAKRGHTVVPSSSLIPTDSTVLFTTAGMQQFIPFLSGKVKPPHPKACSCQKCFRTDDIDEVGDKFHHTFFEMLGNWSFGDYFKEGAIEFALEFLIKECRIPKERLCFTIFKGEERLPRDVQSLKIWQKQGIPKEKIWEFGTKENLWGPVGKTGPCGPCSEIHYDQTLTPCKRGKNCGPNCDCERFVEIWNLVFMEYNKNGKGEYENLAQKNIDTGIGFERLTAVLQEKDSDYETDLFLPLLEKIEEFSGKKYKDFVKEFRIISDHTRGAVFLIAEGIFPSNLERGYVLRRVLRRAIRYGKTLNLPENFLIPLTQKVIEIYRDIYPEIKSKETDILTVLQKEEEKFEKTLERGLAQFARLLKSKIILPAEGHGAKTIEGKEVFDLYQSFGFPLELTKELVREKGLEVDEKGFFEAQKKHQEISKSGAEKKFGGHDIEKIKDEESKIKMTKLHTATHLLHQALREVLGEHAKQMGSDINTERLRFDFSHSQKMSEEELRKVEALLNQKIKEDLEVKKEEMDYEEALKSGALAFFKEKYPEKVSVYSINNWSKEICAGPHVKRTGELGHFKIIKEESCQAGVRRIKAILE